ncbi:hypothetical protein RED65_05942 [Oceanobacter sp. RED65]|uniref:Uncharacterized protein n=1 Tax=Bermanella marisrubri TaxID=207949 RepID=Q1MZH7_9GAMM|nr:hypothetical protein RED65_05942 [Oceanobacter sp. RED65] [Bermanella marisrubri]
MEGRLAALEFAHLFCLRERIDSYINIECHSYVLLQFSDIQRQAHHAIKTMLKMWY